MPPLPRLQVLETVQLIKVVFKLKLQAEFGEGLRLIGGHESMGSWSLAKSVPMRWSPGDVWKTDPLELPVDGVFVYKYVRCADGDAGRPLSWQQGNNQVLTLSAADAPLLEVQDNWRGDPSSASTSAPDGSRRMQLEDRLVARVRDTDKALREAQGQIAALTDELRHAKLQAKALREEARLGANVRLALKDQLRAEKKRSNILEQQVETWKVRARRQPLKGGWARRLMPHALTPCPAVQAKLGSGSAGPQARLGAGANGKAASEPATVPPDDDE